MLDFEENKRHLEQLKNKIKELGESQKKNDPRSNLLLSLKLF